MSKCLIVLPTVARPIIILRVTRRPGLPSSIAVAAGDFRPLPFSKDYDAFTGPGGPLGRLDAPRADTRYELRLSEPFDSGRSWELPVLLAHVLAQAGHDLASRPGDADLVVWATGALDLDLALVALDYCLAAKLSASRALLAEAQAAGVPTLVCIPDTPEAGAVAGWLAEIAPGLRHQVIPVAQAGAAIAALPTGPRPGHGARMSGGSAARWWRRPGYGIGLTAGLIAAASAIAVALHDPAATAAWRAVVDAFASAGPAAHDPAPPGGPAVAADEAVPPPQGLAGAARSPGQPLIVLEELRASPRSSCTRILFADDVPGIRTLSAQGGAFPDSRSGDLCGLQVRKVDPADSLAVEIEGKAVVDAVVQAERPVGGRSDHAIVLRYLFRPGERVSGEYSLRVHRRGGDTDRAVQTFSHRLVGN